MPQIHSIKSVIVQFLNWLTLKLALLGFRQLTSTALIRVGSPYGGYWIPDPVKSSLHLDAFISIGLGRDISFDVAMLNFGMFGIGVDPIQEYIESAANITRDLDLIKNYSLFSKAITESGGNLVLYPPSTGDSWKTASNASDINSSHGTTFPGMSLSQLMSDLPERCTSVIIKLDIEGIELEILRDQAISDSRINYLLIEFDCLSLIPAKRLFVRLRRIIEARKAISKLYGKSFELVKIEEFNLAFTRQHF